MPLTPLQDRIGRAIFEAQGVIGSFARGLGPRSGKSRAETPHPKVSSKRFLAKLLAEN